MGNRAVITFAQTTSAPCIYLHWNGGRASVEGFLRAARHLALNAPMLAEPRGHNFAAQAQVLDAVASLLAEHFFGTEVGRTVYRETYGSTDTDNGDNGVYVIDVNLDIVRREFMRHDEELGADKTLAIYTALIQAVAETD